MPNYSSSLPVVTSPKIKTELKEATVTKVFYLGNNWASFSVNCKKGRFNCSGKIKYPVAVGDKLNIKGLFFIDKKYGPKVEIEEAEVTEQNFVGSYSQTLIFNYLISSAVKYLNEDKAKALVDKFGDKVIDVAKNTPEDLTCIKGIGPKTAKLIAQSIADNSALIEIMSLLPGVTISEAQTLYKRFGSATVQKLEQNPYIVMYELERYGFKRADKLALRMGVSTYDKRRLGAAVYYVIDNSATKGHCFVKVDGIEELLVNGKDALIPELKGRETLIAEAIADEIKEKHLILDGPEDLYVFATYVAETKAAQYIAELATTAPSFSISTQNLNKAIKAAAFESLFELDNAQKFAVKNCFENRISVVTGGPGSGKSTIINTIKKCYEYSDHSGHLILLAPTGKAANRIKEVTNFSANTIHSTLIQAEIKPAFFQNSLFVVDESSMIDLPLAYKLLKLIHLSNSSVVFIGDKDQLPPIGAGTFFCDLIANSNISTSLLTISHRQVGTIAKNANSINQGFSTKSFQYDEHFKFICADSPDIKQLIINEYKKLLTQYSISDVCVLVPKRKKSSNNTYTSYSTEDLNPELLKIANPESPMNSNKKIRGFKVGDRVMQTINDKVREFYNGDVATITEIDIKNQRIELITDQGLRVSATGTEILELRLAYSLTIHKVQGSEYKATIVALSNSDYYMLQRNLLYTAVTRAKDKLILIGSPSAINAAINKIDAFQRNSKLNARIDAEIAKTNLYS